MVSVTSVKPLKMNCSNWNTLTEPLHQYMYWDYQLRHWTAVYWVENERKNENMVHPLPIQPW